MKKRIENNNSIIPLIAGPILSLVAFVVLFYLDPLKFEEYSPWAALPAFLFSVIILLIHQTIRTLVQVRNGNNQSMKIYDAVKDYLHVTSVGNPENSLKYIYSRLPSLREVKNTSFNVEMELERAEEKLYNTQVYNILQNDLSTYVGRNLLWKDVGDRNAISRFRKVADQVNANPNYKYKLVEVNVPIINFILLEFTDGSKEVLFNWDFRSRGQDPTVLVSRDQQIIEMFTIQFGHLWESASIDHDNVATKSTSIK